ncbi:hypothetical protein EDD80_101468 [Anseongella ginsenosidimutans]|uniref:Uncharacterized protein n=1 Tax=Anseongella ginsenosidimutans TaxID=496056 RepID=A0A4R3KXR5_9SPHI|nr:hypothetical protein EDD80_101468 [Anseongella ginsenosidimutans]
MILCNSNKQRGKYIGLESLNICIMLDVNIDDNLSIYQIKYFKLNSKKLFLKKKCNRVHMQ